MLGKTKKHENETSFSVPKKEEEKPAPAPPRPTPKPSEEKTTIGEHITIEGQIKGQEHLIIEGALKGNVEMEKHNYIRYIKNHSLSTFNFCGESHDKGLPEGVNMKASEGVLFPLKAFSSLFKTISQHS